MLDKRLFPIIETGREEKGRLSELNKTIDDLFEKNRIKEAQELKTDSVKKLTILYSPWICNFRCPDYCYTKGTDDGVLTSAQAIGVIEQAKELGIRVTYWPGEGEITLLKEFWQIMDYQTQEELPAVVFTNGTIFHKDGNIQKIRENPNMYLYVKYWSSNPEKAAQMVGVDPKEYPYETVEGRKIPLALAKLICEIGKERVGAEVMVSKENYEDIVDNVLPMINELGIYGYVEPVIFSGNAQGKQQDLSLNPSQYQHLAGIFASGGNYCEKRQSTELMIKGSKLIPGIAIPPREQDTIIDESSKIKDLFMIFHNKYFREMRKISEDLNGCLCRAYWNGGIRKS